MSNTTPVKYVVEQLYFEQICDFITFCLLFSFSHNDLPYQFYEQAGNHLDLLDLRDDLRGKTHTDIDRIRKGQLGGVVSCHLYKYSHIWSIEVMFFLQFFVAYSNCRTQFKDAVEFGMQQVDLIHRLAREYPDRFEMAYTNDGQSENVILIIKIFDAKKIPSSFAQMSGVRTARGRRPP